MRGLRGRAVTTMLQRLRDRLTGRPPTTGGYDAGVLTDADQVPAGRLIAELGLEIAARPSRAHPGWRRPDRVLVMGASPERLAWLALEADDVGLVGAATAEEGEALVEEADGLIGWFTPAMIARATRLRWLQLQRAGAESVTRLPGFAARGIVVTSLKRLASPVVADHAMALLLALVRRLPELAAHQARRQWGQAEVQAAHLGTLHGRRLLVAGLGGIGTAISRRASGFGMTVTAVRAGHGALPPGVDRVGTPRDLAPMAAEADVVINALPLTDATRGLFDRALFDRLPTGALFVNVGRGASVKTDDLASALRDGPLAGVALDVVEPQPLPPSHPLWSLPNVLITPHIASWSATTAAWGWVIARENLRRYVAGEPLVSEVDLARGY